MIPGLKTCAALFTWIAQAISIGPKKEPNTLLDQLSKGINEGAYSTPFTKKIQELSEKDTQTRKSQAESNGKGKKE